jgi:hypothetical protein
VPSEPISDSPDERPAGEKFPDHSDSPVRFTPAMPGGMFVLLGLGFTPVGQTRALIVRSLRCTVSRRISYIDTGVDPERCTAGKTQP